MILGSPEPDPTKRFSVAHELAFPFIDLVEEDVRELPPAHHHPLPYNAGFDPEDPDFTDEDAVIRGLYQRAFAAEPGDDLGFDPVRALQDLRDRIASRQASSQPPQPPIVEGEK